MSIKRALAMALAVALALVCCPALAEETIGARTSITGLAWERLSNLNAAAERIDGAVVPGGSSFSFNEAIGGVTQANGFQAAANGSGAVANGGGIDQAATTLYLALNQLGGDICFDEKHAYGERFTGAYVADGANAIQVDEAAGLDFRFTNLGGELTIHMYLSGDSLFCSLDVQPALADGFLPWAGHGPQLRSPAGSAEIALEGSEALISNITLAASSINDTVLSQGDLFSFNESVGPRSERFGYQSAVNGRGSKVIGGGVAQVASAIWLAVKNLDGVAIVEKSTYGGRYNQHYVESSNDAILTDYNTGADFSFRNTGAEPLTIAVYVRDGVLRCEIYRG